MARGPRAIRDDVSRALNLVLRAARELFPGCSDAFAVIALFERQARERQAYLDRREVDLLDSRQFRERFWSYVSS